MSRRSPRLFLVALVALIASGCGKDKCKDEPPSLQLDLSLADPSLQSAVRALRLELVSAGQGRRRQIELGSALLDGQTSIALALEPPFGSEGEITIEVIALDAGGAERARARGTQRVTPDGCNRASLALSAGPAPDGGAADAEPGDGPAPDAPEIGADVPALDGGPDAGVLDAPDPDADPADAPAPDVIDALDGEVPDNEVPDGGAPPIAFPFTPSNFDPTSLAPLVELHIDCGDVTFDSSSLSFDRSCGAPLPVALSINQPPLGPPLAVIPVVRFSVAAGSRLILTGQRPVAIAVFGDATIAGAIDATARRAEPGPGGSLGFPCLGSEGDEAFGSRGGGGGGGLVGDGGDGGDDARGGNGGNGGNGNNPGVSPLRGGCAGGPGGANGGAGGGGGGAIQISAAGRLTLLGVLAAAGGGGGGGGRREGGGGGGSGGLILLEADVLDAMGTLYAQGGAGGGGGPEQNSGGSGGDGEDGDRAAPLGGLGAGGEGGDGAVPGATGGDAPPIGGGGNPGAGGGGGGGGAGLIQLVGETSCQDASAGIPPVSGC